MYLLFWSMPISSMIGGRSGNRGKCAQGCRLPYELIENEKMF